MLMAWVEFLKDPESEVVRSLEKHNTYIREAKDELYRLSNDAKERERYNAREKALKDKNSALKAAMEKGMEQGIYKVASALLDVLDDEMIALKTGLSTEEVKGLRMQRQTKVNTFVTITGT